MTAEIIFFYAFAVLALASALAMVTFLRNVVAGVMSLVVTMVSLSGIFVLLGAEFVGVIQIMVYAGAIMVLLLFVVMLLNLESDDFGPPRSLRGVSKLVGVLAAIAVAASLGVALSGGLPAPAAVPDGFGGTRAMGRALFSEFVMPVETAGLLLLAAIVGAVILAKKRID